jgi:hypothetical protein
MTKTIENFQHGFTILGVIAFVLILLVLAFHTFNILKNAIRDTLKWPFNYKLPLVFLGNLWDQFIAECQGQEVVISPVKKD